MKHLCLFLFLLFSPTLTVAQSLVTDVRIRLLDATRLEILYNLTGPADSVWFEAEARFGGQLYPSSAYLYGDFGRNVPPGPNRRIVWYLYDEGQRIKTDVRVRVLARTPILPGAIVQEAPEAIELHPVLNDKRRWSVGPGWAGLSAVLPGVGNMFVHRSETGSPKLRVGVRPVATVGFYGLLLYGLNQRRLSQAWFMAYKQQKNATNGEPFYQMANQYHRRYYVASRAAALIWATDVTLTLVQGFRNRHAARKRAAVTMNPGWQNGVPVALVRVRL